MFLLVQIITTCCNCTSEGHGASNTGYLNIYRVQRSECSDGDLNYLRGDWTP